MVKLSQIDNTGPFNIISQKITAFRAGVIKTNKIIARHRTSYHHGLFILLRKNSVE